MPIEKPLKKKGGERFFCPPETRQGRSRKKLLTSKQNAMHLGSRIRLLSTALRKHANFFDEKALSNLSGLIQQLHDLLREHPWLRKNHHALMIEETKADYSIILLISPETLRKIGI